MSFEKYFDDFRYPLDQEPCLRRAFTALLLAYLLLALAFSRLSTFALSGFSFSSFFSFLEGFR